MFWIIHNFSVKSSYPSKQEFILKRKQFKNKNQKNDVGQNYDFKTI